VHARPVSSTPIEGRLRSAAERLAFDPLIVAVGAVAAAVYALHGFQGTLTRDGGVYAYAGQQVANGVPPYLGVLNRAGPLAHLIPGLGAWAARLVGIDDLLGIRVLFMGIATACVAATYCLGRDLFASRATGLVSAATFLGFLGFIQHATYGPRDKTVMVLFLTLSLIAMTRRRWLWAGVWLAFSTLVLQVVAFVGGPALLVAALLTDGGRRDRLRALGRVVVGGLFPFAAITVWFAAIGALPEFFDGYLWINAQYTVASPVTDHPAKVVRSLMRGYQMSLVLLVGGLVAILALGGRAVFSPGDDRSRGPLVGLAVGVLSGLGWTARDFDAWPDAYILLPLAAVGVGGALHPLLRRLRPRLVVAVVLVWCCALTGLALNKSLHGNDQLERQRISVRSVLGVLPDDATIVSIEAPQPLVLLGQTNPTRYQMFSRGLQRWMDDNWPGGMAGYRRWIVAQAPTLIVIKSPNGAWWAKAIQGSYFLVGCAPGWAWYANRSLPRETLLALGRAKTGRCDRAHEQFRE
jgi:hypothetical protein